MKVFLSAVTVFLFLAVVCGCSTDNEYFNSPQNPAKVPIKKYMNKNEDEQLRQTGGRDLFS